MFIIFKNVDLLDMFVLVNIIFFLEILIEFEIGFLSKGCILFFIFNEVFLINLGLLYFFLLLF